MNVLQCQKLSFLYTLNKRKHVSTINLQHFPSTRARASARGRYTNLQDIAFAPSALPCGKGDSIFSSVGKFKESLTLRGREKKGRVADERDERGRGRFATRLRRRWIDVRKTRNSLDPGSSRVAVVVHAINQSIDSSPLPAPAKRNFCLRHTGGKMEAPRCMGD